MGEKKTADMPLVSEGPHALYRRDTETGFARINPQDLIQQAIEAGSGIETLERLVDLAIRVREQDAKEAWYAAMAEFQRTCPPIPKTRTADVPTKSGGRFSYTYAPLDEILSVVQPIMGALGLSIQWGLKYQPNVVIANCRILHRLGHSEESGELGIPVDMSSGIGANAAQRVGIATTYAKRYALRAALGIEPEGDPDAQGTDRPAPAEPRRKSGATDAPKQSAPLRVEVLDYQKSTGTKKTGETWTLHTLTFRTEDGKQFQAGTFSSSVAKSLMAYKTEGQLPCVVFARTDKGINIETIVEEDSQEETIQ